MKNHWLTFLVSLLFVSVSCHSALKESKQEGETFTQYHTVVDNESRSYGVYKPRVVLSEMGEKASLPILFMFHGSRSSGKDINKGTEFNRIAEREKIIVVYPDALVGNWAEGCDCNNADRLKVQDVEFVQKMIEEVREKYTADSSNVFAAGFSQGGLFVNRLACELSNDLKGAVVIAATLSVPLSKTCTPGNPIPMTFIQGTDDSVLPYSGIQNGLLSLKSAKEAVQFWAEKNGIPGDPLVSHLPDSTNPRVEILRYPPKENNTAGVTLFSIKNFGHGWPMLNYFNTNERIASFIGEYRVQQTTKF